MSDLERRLAHGQLAGDFDFDQLTPEPAIVIRRYPTVAEDVVGLAAMAGARVLVFLAVPRATACAEDEAWLLQRAQRELPVAPRPNLKVVG